MKGPPCLISCERRASKKEVSIGILKASNSFAGEAFDYAWKRALDTRLKARRRSRIA